MPEKKPEAFFPSTPDPLRSPHPPYAAGVGVPNDTEGPPMAKTHLGSQAKVVVSTIQNAIGNMASVAERVGHLVTWVDPRASTIFNVVCLVVAIVMAVVPLRIVLAFVGLFALRPPQLRDPKPPPPINLLQRVPTRLDQVCDAPPTPSAQRTLGTL